MLYHKKVFFNGVKCIIFLPDDFHSLRHAHDLKEPKAIKIFSIFSSNTAIVRMISGTLNYLEFIFARCDSIVISPSNVNKLGNGGKNIYLTNALLRLKEVLFLNCLARLGI